MNVAQLAAYAYLNGLRLSGKVELYQPTYNPQNYPLLGSDKVRRVTTDRLKVMLQTIDFNKQKSYLDLGCQIGYFVFVVGAAYPKIEVMGYDQELAAYSYARALRCIYPLGNVKFKRFLLTKDTVVQVPRVSVISLLSVWHHIVYRQGREAADAILGKLKDKCDYLVFETGQADEIGLPWSNSLKFMGNKPRDWVRSHLRHLGYKVISEKESPTHLTRVPRSMFICRAR